MTFEDLKITRQFLNAIADMGYTTPSPIQERAIPPLLSGQHLIGIAQTGTGKTAAYLIPILQTLKYAQGVSPRALILVPTKELVLQVLETAKQVAKYTDLRCQGIYGGVGKTEQSKQIRLGCDLLVATPRRLEELYEDGVLVLKTVKTMVLDEADRMMDMGFLPQINHLLDILPTKKQNMLFSATFSPKIEELSENFMDFPMRIEIAQEATPADKVVQLRYEVPNLASKLNVIEHFLKTDSKAFKRVMVFTRTKGIADLVTERLKKTTRGSVKVIHSNKAQNARINAMNEFKNGDLTVLVATDVASRGIDVSEVSHVINFDVPIVYEDYVHRIGRTARAGFDGIAITLVNPAEEYHFEQIEAKIRQKITPSPLPESIEMTVTPYEEDQAMLREIDERKQRLDPNYKGAFHDKQNEYTPTSEIGKARLRNKQILAANGKKTANPLTNSKKNTPSPFVKTARTATSKYGRHKKKGGK